MTIQPFNHAVPNPLSSIAEGKSSLFLYVRECSLLQLADAVWRAISIEERQHLLKHLWDNAHVDCGGRRFRDLREMMDEEFGPEESFLSLALVGDFDGNIPMELHPWVALYVDESRGARESRFSSDAFYKHYREAHEWFPA